MNIKLNSNELLYVIGDNLMLSIVHVLILIGALCIDFENKALYFVLAWLNETRVKIPTHNLSQNLSLSHKMKPGCVSIASSQ